jgi:alpha-L-rhamnosidase
MDVTVPVGCTATVYVPADSENNVTENGKRIKQSGIISFSQLKDGYAIYNIASGKYNFLSALKQ